MIVAGVMSGTSADGIDVALVEIRSGARGPRLKLLGYAGFPYPGPVRRAVLAAMNSQNARIAELARLNFVLGELYADAVRTTQKKLRYKADLVGCHGQTIYHQGTPAPFLGRKLAVTWQTGEASRIAARLGVPVVSDFRPADMAAGGTGAPLVPYLDYLIYRDRRVGRIALNIGGIANVAAIQANAFLDQVIAFDTGPGNMVMDALTEELFGRTYDRDGKIAAHGEVRDAVIENFLRRNFFKEKPPKTAGREEFGREFVREFRQVCRGRQPSKNANGGGRSMRKEDVIATATAFTARSITDALRRHVLPCGHFSEVIASGGGTRNPSLMAMLANEAGAIGLKLRTSDEFGIPSEAKEAVAFAVLAYETWHQRPSNVPSATGAKRAVVLGKVSYP
ncbi:MAG: anhydro-N-acetylmuramic acid kinase [Acidobacteria bacterium]|nr:MAG: anhydro-N-acetylmuramic acid kinase [Acidobacteriota bacterium]